MLRPYKSLSLPREASERVILSAAGAKDLPDRSTRRRIVDHLGRAARREGGNHKGKVLPII